VVLTRDSATCPAPAAERVSERDGAGLDEGERIW
jgi:hypothetical protein